MSQFQKSLMDFTLQMSLNSFLCIVDGLNCSTSLTDLYVNLNILFVAFEHYYLYHSLIKSISFAILASRLILDIEHYRQFDLANQKSMLASSYFKYLVRWR